MQAAEELSATMINISNWLENSCLHLNADKTICTFFLICKFRSRCYSTVAEKILSVVRAFRYLGIIIDSQLTFKTQVKKVVNRIKFNFKSNFRHIRNNLTTEASKLYINAIIFSHWNFCLPVGLRQDGPHYDQLKHFMYRL